MKLTCKYSKDSRTLALYFPEEFDTSTLAAGSVTTEILANDSVSTAKIANAAIESVKIATASITGEKVATAAIGSSHLQDAIITVGKIANLAVDNSKLADLAITAGKLASNSVTETKIVNSAITNVKLANASVDTAKLGALSVTAAKLANASVDFSTKVTGAEKPANNADVTANSSQAVSWLTNAGNLATLNTVGSTQIDNAAITNTKIAALAVDAAKLASSSVTSTKIANAAVGSAAIANLAVGTAAIANTAITSAKIDNLAVGSAALANAAVTNAKIGNLAVDTAQIANGAIESAKIANLAVGSAAIASLAVGSAKIADAAIIEAKIDNLAVTSAKIGNLAVGTAQISNAAITNAKINSLDAAKITTGEILLARTEAKCTVSHTDPDIANALEENSALTISRPVGATYSNNSSSLVGVIKITLPQSWTSTMMRFVVDIFEYVAGLSFSLELAGYNYTSGTQWTHTTANLTGAIAANNRVRFGHDGTKCCICIGETTSDWSHLKATVRDFQAGYDNYAKAQWDDGWSIGVVSDLTGYTFTSDRSDSLIDAQSIVNQGALAIKSSVNLATGDVTNKVLDNLSNGTYSKVLTTSISAGQILLTEGVTGSLPVANSDAKCTDALADQTSAHACNDPWSGHDLDDLANGTYGKVLTTAISAGKIVLTSSGVTGTLPTSLSVAKCTDALADQTSAHNCLNPGDYTASQNQGVAWLNEAVGSSLPIANTDAKCTDAAADQTSINTALNSARTQECVTTIQRPGGAAYSGGSSGTGVIKITLPQSWTNTMMRFFLDVFEYTAGLSFTLELAGYNYSNSSTWVNCTTSLTGSIAANNRVRFGHDGTKCCICIGETTSNWAFLKASVRDFQAANTSYSISQWDDDWSISVVNDLSGITFTADHSDALIDASSIKDQGALATQGSVDLATAEVTNKDLDNIADGATYARVLNTDITSGHILLSACTGSLDNIDNGTTYGRVNITAISAGNILLSTCSGDLDDIANGTYGKVLTTAISAGKIVLTSSGVTGTLPTSLSAAKCTNANADQTSAHNCLNPGDYTASHSQGVSWLNESVGSVLPVANTDAKCTDATADKTSTHTAANAAAYTGALIATSYTVAKCTDANADQTSAHTAANAAAYTGANIATIYTAAKCTDATADKTSTHNCLNPGDYTASHGQNIGWLIGSSGELTISAGGRLKLNCANALEIQAADGVRVDSASGIKILSGGGLHLDQGGKIGNDELEDSHFSLSNYEGFLGKGLDVKLSPTPSGAYDGNLTWYSEHSFFEIVVTAQVSGSEKTKFISKGFKTTVRTTCTITNVEDLGNTWKLTFSEGGLTNDRQIGNFIDPTSGWTGAWPGTLTIIDNGTNWVTVVKGLSDTPVNTNTFSIKGRYGGGSTDSTFAHALFFTKGSNINFGARILSRNFATGEVELYSAAPYDIEVGDKFKGSCDRAELEWNWNNDRMMLTPSARNPNDTTLYLGGGGLQPGKEFSIIYLQADTRVEVVAPYLKIGTIPAATTDTDKFLVSDSGVVKYRTGAQVLSDVGITSDERIKAWINFNGAGTIAINDSFNVTSITDNGVGNYTVTWDTDFANTTYSVTLGGNAEIIQSYSLTVGTVGIMTKNNTGTLTDYTLICANAIGDQ